MRAAYTGEFRLESCRVPADHLLGGQDNLEEKLAAARAAVRPEGAAPARRGAQGRRG